MKQRLTCRRTGCVAYRKPSRHRYLLSLGLAVALGGGLTLGRYLAGTVPAED